MVQFITAINEIRDAKEIILALTRRVYMSTEGSAARTLIYDMGVCNLIYAHNEVAKYRAPSKVLDKDHYPVKGFSQLKELDTRLAQLDVVMGWLADPFLFDSRKELRDATLVNLDKAMMVLESVIEFVANPR